LTVAVSGFLGGLRLRFLGFLKSRLSFAVLDATAACDEAGFGPEPMTLCPK
jgi:hypothetical protein